MSKSLFIFGFGFSSTAIAAECRAAFDTITGTTRSAEKAGHFSQHGVEGLVFDGSSLTPEIRDRMATTTHLLISIAPKQTDPVLEALEHDVKQYCPNLEWAGYLSTVGVYGNHDGAWVDETTAPIPVSDRSVWRVNAERDWQLAAQKANVPLAIFRLSGIYGPGRNAFMNIEKGTARRLVKPGQVFNRIHRDDIGQAVAKAMSTNIDGIFNITDDEPSPPQDVVTYAHELKGIEPPPALDFETADLSPMARSFYGENKRVSNQKSKDLLGMQYRWPDYRTSLKRMYEEESWKPV